jgi:scyllo-inositol 2-dehydrogenase (NADP+)
MSERKISIGVLGLGRAGWDIHVAQLRNHPRFHLAEVADPDPSRLAQAVAELGCTGYASLSEMLEKGLAEVIVVATPNTLHEADAMAVFAAGRHCVVEKPVSLSYQGACEVAAKASEAGCQLFAHHQLLFSPEFAFLREVVDSGVLGEIFEIRFNWVSYSRRNDWQTLLANGGGLFNNHGPHALSVMLNLLGAEVDEMNGGLRHLKDAGDAEDHVHFLLRTANGRMGDLFLSTSCALPLPRFVMLGRCGTAVSLGNGQAQLRYYDPTLAPALTVKDGAAENRSYKNEDQLAWQEEVRSFAPPQDTPTFYDNVAGVLLDGAPMVVTPASALEVARVLEWGQQGYDPSVAISPVLELAERQ